MTRRNPANPRSPASGLRASGTIPDAGRQRLNEVRAQSQYQEMLRDELGRDPRANHALSQNGMSWGDALTRPLALVLITFLTFTVLLAAMLWRDGAFNPWFAPKNAQVEPGSKAWILESRQQPIDVEAAAPEESPQPKKTDSKAGKDIATDKSPAEEASESHESLEEE